MTGQSQRACLHVQSRGLRLSEVVLSEQWPFLSIKPLNTGPGSEKN